MFFNRYYTTQMSASKNQLKMRFVKIRSENGKRARIFSLITAVILIFTAMIATVAVSALEGDRANTVEVLYNGKEQHLNSSPFVYQSEVYLPLREILNICGIDNDKISYDNGSINIKFSSEKTDVNAKIEINKHGVTFDTDKKYRIMGYERDEIPVRSTTHPALLVNDTTYVPVGMILRIKNYYIAHDYDDRDYLDFLTGLEVRWYGSDGKYDTVVCLPVYAAGDKYNPQNYYSEHERVVIGTAADFDNENFETTEINNYYFPVNAKKHILLDENGKVMAVMPYENFRHESIDNAGGGVSQWSMLADFRRVSSYKPPSYMKKVEDNRGGVTVFKNEQRGDHNYCLSYCFADKRYYIK